MKETVTHLTLLATVTQRLLVENQKLLQENQQLRQKELGIEDESCTSLLAVQASFHKLSEENRELHESTAAFFQQLNTKYDSVVAENLKPVQQSIQKLEKEKHQHFGLSHKQTITNSEI